MRFPVVSSLLVCLGFSAALARADSVPVVEPVDETPSTAATPESGTEAPVVTPVSYAEPVATAESATASRAASGEWNRASVKPGKITTQSHTGYYVNRVKFAIPAGVKLDVKKDWYAKDIVIEYPANPYTNWQGVTPEAFTFKHTGTTLEVRHATPKYLPKVIVVRVPAAIEVGA